ncbi:FtsX-like permease family protein [Chloroflexi bacterium TSY]|nr:FtsX-like permease family protein [Chloroflexi bacterium TSY]
MSIFTSFTQSIVIAFLVAISLVLLLMLLISLRNHIVAKMGFRNIPRRPAQTILIILGLTLSTIIIISSLAIGDTLTYSVRRQAVDAYGHIDEVLSPPLLGTLAQYGVNFEDGDPDDVTVDTENAEQAALLEGGITSVFALLQDGLPGISEERYAELRTRAKQEELIDGIAPGILFPVIVRNRTSGQGEPYGFIFAVDDEYQEDFSLHTIDGKPATMAILRPGVGNIFEFASDLFALVNSATADIASRLGFDEVGVTDVVAGVAALGSAITTPLEGQANNIAPNSNSSSTASDGDAVNQEVEQTSAQVDSSNADRENADDDADSNNDRTGNAIVESSDNQNQDESTVSQAESDIRQSEEPGAANTENTNEVSPNEESPDVSNSDEEASSNAIEEGVETDGTNDESNTSGSDLTESRPNESAPEDASDSALPFNLEELAQILADQDIDLNSLLTNLGLDPETTDIEEITNNLLSSINLNTLGEEIDRVLGQVGLELRRGEVYLSRIGAERLNARPGDILDIYIGPIPVPYRIVDIVDEAGPVAALAPVVVMPIDEAQRLLFMENRVNAVLVSNQGDQLEGLELTDEVSNRLRALVLNDQKVDELMTLLREPDIRPVLEREIEREISESIIAEDSDDQPPAFLATFLEDTFGVGRMARNLQTLQNELDSPTVSDELKRVLADLEIQFWLTDLGRLPDERQDELSQAVSQLTELELVTPLSKQTVVTAAGIGGTVFTSIFSLFGFFSILAGILLIFMIFIMLAADRRSEMGMARAIGMQRSQLVQMFVTEGVIYDLLAAAVGVVLGLAVSYAMIGFVDGLFNDIAGTLNDQVQLESIFTFHFTVVPSSIVIAYCAGVLFTFLIVTAASYRVSRLNIVAAIRELPEDNFSRRRSWVQHIARFIAGPALIAGGIYVILFDETLEITRTQLGATLIVFGVAFFLGWFFFWRDVRTETRQRIIYSIIGIGLLLLWVVPWSRLLTGEGSIFDQNPATVLLSFALSGPLIILGGILTVIYNADGLLWGINRLLGGVGFLTPVLKTAIAYPLSSRFRTGMAMLLFAMVITTVVIMSVVIQATETIVTPDDERYVGFEIEVNRTLLSFFNPIDDLEAEIAQMPDFPAADVASIGRVSELQVRIDDIEVDGETVESNRASNTRLTGINPGYVNQAEQHYTFQLRAPGYETDADVWQALRERDDVAIVTPRMVEEGVSEDVAEDVEVSVTVDADDNGRDRERGPDSGDWRRRLRRLPGFTLADTTMPQVTLLVGPEAEDIEAGADDEQIAVEIIGVLAEDDTLADGNIQVNDALLMRLTDTVLETPSFYIKAAEGADVRSVAQEVERAFISGGLNSSIMAESFAAGQAVTRGILRLFQGFMALGLLVGIAALGVISSRTVVERRQQVGMLRAIGYQPRMVMLSFLLEASFIALVGIGLGTATGVLLGRNIVGELYTVISGQPFATPWVQIGLILLLAYLASLLTTILPAYQASRIYPAEALRYD